MCLDNDSVVEFQTFELCLGLEGDLTSARTFIADGEYTTSYKPIADGLAKFAHGEEVLETTPAGQKTNDPYWVAMSGSITCAPAGDHIACQFENLSFADGSKPSVQSGWIHAPLR